MAGNTRYAANDVFATSPVSSFALPMSSCPLLTVGGGPSEGNAASTGKNEEGSKAKAEQRSSRPWWSRLYERWVTDWWVSELLAVLFSVLFTVALCVTLYKSQHRPILSYGSIFGSGITLGAFVAVSAALSVAASQVSIQQGPSQLQWLAFAKRPEPLSQLRAFDEASRGALGSALLVARQRARPLPTLGPLLAMFTIAVAPLAQQAVQFVTTSTPQDSIFRAGLLYASIEDVKLGVDLDNPSSKSRAFIPIANTWGDEAPIGVSGVLNALIDISLGKKGAILSGLFTTSGMTPESPPECSTGNCTFPPYHSRAICSQAGNVTSQLRAMPVGNSPNYTWCLTGVDACVNSIP